MRRACCWRINKAVGQARSPNLRQAHDSHVNLCKAQQPTSSDGCSATFSRHVPIARIAMNNARRRFLSFAATAAAGTALSACVVVPAGRGYPSAGGYGGGYGDGYEVSVAPPAPHYEVAIAAPGPGFLWIGGHWRWGGHRHAWVPGHWTRPRHGHHWEPHRWQQHGRGWRESPGHWRPR